MPAATYNIIIEQGATYSKTLTVLDSNNNPIDLTGAQIRAQMRHRAQFDEKWDFDAQVINAANGVLEWSMTPAVTKTIDVAQGVYDLEIEWLDGRIERLLEGQVTVKQNITREV